MRYGIRHFHRPVCAYPDCGNEYDGDEAEWWSDPYWPLDQAWEDDWLVLDGRLGEPVCICSTAGTAGRCRSDMRYCRPRWRSVARTRGCRP